MFRIFPKFYARRKGDLRKVAVAILLCFIIALIFSAQFRYELRSLLEYPLHYKESNNLGYAYRANTAYMALMSANGKAAWTGSVSKK